jgi:hypothetical protein
MELRRALTTSHAAAASESLPFLRSQAAVGWPRFATTSCGFVRQLTCAGFTTPAAVETYADFVGRRVDTLRVAAGSPAVSPSTITSR